MTITEPAVPGTFEFNPDQPRDEQGRWVGEGAGESPSAAPGLSSWREDAKKAGDAVGSGPYAVRMGDFAPQAGRDDAQVIADKLSQIGSGVGAVDHLEPEEGSAVAAAAVVSDVIARAEPVDPEQFRPGGTATSMGNCHWNTVIQAAKDPERYRIEHGYALVPNAGNGAQNGEGYATGVWMPHTWIADERTGARIETNISPAAVKAARVAGETGVAADGHYAAYVGAQLDKAQTETFVLALRADPRSDDYITGTRVGGTAESRSYEPIYSPAGERILQRWYEAQGEVLAWARSS